MHLKISNNIALSIFIEVSETMSINQLGILKRCVKYISNNYFDNKINVNEKNQDQKKKYLCAMQHFKTNIC